MRLALFVLLGSIACNGPRSGTETGNPNTKVAARIAGGSYSSDPTEISSGPGGRITVDRAWAWFERIRFRDEAACAEEVDEELPDDEPFVVELVGGGLTTRQLPAGPYCGLRLELDSPSDPPTTAPPDLGGVTFVFEGIADDGLPYRAVSSEGLSMDLEGIFTIDADQRSFVVGLDVAVWFDGLDVATLPLVDGVHILDDLADPTATEIFEDNIQRSVALFADLDGSGTLDVLETTDPLALPVE